jgi:AraC-like DNA-binding protein
MDPEEEKENPVLPIFLSAREPLILCDPMIENAMERLRKILENDSDPMGDTREGVILLDVILSIFGRLSAKGKKPPKKQSQTKLRQKWLIEEHIFTRYHDPDGLDGLASKLYLSQRQTRKLVKHFYGEDYKTLIVRQRMEMAQLFLESPTLSLEEVAEKVGYRSYSGFHLAFVRSFGITPGEYRKQKQK